jgi:D-serine/D-alanine/glycine transporter
MTNDGPSEPEQHRQVQQEENHMVDQVKVAADEQAPTEQSLRRNLTNRHIQLIAIGGAIGTGLFMGSGKTISLAGPSIIFVYMIIGFMLFFVMRAMGELLLSNLEYKSFSDFAADLLGRGRAILPAGPTGSAGW